MTTCRKCKEELFPEQIWQSVEGSFCEKCYREAGQVLTPAGRMAAVIAAAPSRDVDLRRLDRFEKIREADCIAMLDAIDKLRRTNEAISVLALRQWIRKHYEFTKIQCSKCKQWLRRSEFHRDASKASGYRPDCIVCHKMVKPLELSPERKRKIADYGREWKRQKARQMRERTT